MKRFIALVVCILMFIGAAGAEGLDLSAMSMNELHDLQSKIAKEIVSRPEWKQVKVPAGEWVIGEDIPAGVYSIVIPKGGSAVIHLWGSVVGDYKADGGMRLSDYRKEGEDIGKIELYEGNILELGSPVFLSPPVSLKFF